MMINFLQRYFFSGLLVWLPLLITVMVVSFLIDLLDQTLLLLPEQYRPDQLLGMHIPGFGLLLSLTVLIFTGFLAANFLGRWFIEFGERLFARIPLVRSIYTAVKQVTETLVSPKGQAFRQVVLVEWPRREMWSLAFVTTHSSEKLNTLANEQLVNIFVPATPNITSGFLMMVSASQLREVDISIEEALKLIVSLGVVQPDNPAAINKQFKDAASDIQ